MERTYPALGLGGVGRVPPSRRDDSTDRVADRLADWDQHGLFQHVVELVGSDSDAQPATKRLPRKLRERLDRFLPLAHRGRSDPLGKAHVTNLRPPAGSGFIEGGEVGLQVSGTAG